MASTAQEWQQSGDERNPKQPEPVITFDHMSDAEHTFYFQTTNNKKQVPYTYLFLDGILIAALLTALAVLTF